MEADKFIKQNISTHFSGYIVQNRFFIKTPIDDVLYGYCFENSSKKNKNHIWSFVQPLYIRDNILHLTFGKRLKFKNSEAWNIDEIVDDKYSMDYLLNEMKKEEKEIARLSGPLEFYEFYKKEEHLEENLRVYEAVIYSSIWLSLPSAQKELNDCIEYIYQQEDLSIKWVKEVLDNMLRLRNGFTNAKSILSEWKRETMSALHFL